MSNEIIFYFFRHGQTDWNLEQRLQGHTNTSLNETGRAQALELAQKMDAFKVEVIFSSDLDRAFYTGLAVSQRKQIGIIKDSRLREASFGDAEGMLVSEVKEKFEGDLWEKFKIGDKEALNKSFPNGETRGKSIKRMRSVVDEIIEAREYKNIGISTHGGVVRNLLYSYLPEDHPPLEIPNCVIYSLTYCLKEKTFKVNGPL